MLKRTRGVGSKGWEGHARRRGQLEQRQGGGEALSSGAIRKAVWLEQEGLFEGTVGGYRGQILQSFEFQMAEFG